MSRPIKILFVEDSEPNHLLALRALEKDGLETVTRRVDTARSMRAALAEADFDLVIVDYVLPGFDCVAALEIWRERYPQRPAILVSGSDDLTPVRARHLMAGEFDAYLTKPQDALLAQLIREKLRERKAPKVWLTARRLKALKIIGPALAALLALLTAWLKLKN